jgi:predicted nucleic acid-binding protein
MLHASAMKSLGLKQMDAFHVACAIHAGCHYFLTTDKGILKYATQIQTLHITDPIGFIQETSP